MTCRTCGITNSDENDFCINCGVLLAKNKAINKDTIETPRTNFTLQCGHCGVYNLNTARFCMSCGFMTTNLSKAAMKVFKPKPSPPAEPEAGTSEVKKSTPSKLSVQSHKKADTVIRPSIKKVNTTSQNPSKNSESEIKKKQIASNILKVQRLIFIPLLWGVGFIIIGFILVYSMAAVNDPGDIYWKHVYTSAFWAGIIAFSISFIVLLFRYFLSPAQKWINENASSNEASAAILKNNAAPINEPIDIGELKVLMEQTLHNLVAETANSNPLKGTPFAGYSIIQAVTEGSKVLKEQFKIEKEELGLTEEQIDELVDDVTKKTLKKHISNI